MHVLIAPNAFKHGLDAVGAADAIALGLSESRFKGTWSTCPMGDGGDGTAALLLRHVGGVQTRVRSHDALGREIDAGIAFVGEGRFALIELAEASGLHRLSKAELDPAVATTQGTGELMRAALDRGVEEIVLCVGGSATVDGGSGLLRALGARFLDAADQPLAEAPTALCNLARIDVSRLDPRLRECAITVLCDVVNPLLGSRGAASVFGPQKGATPATVAALETALTRFAAVVSGQTGVQLGALPRAGAAGGAAAGLAGLLGAQLVDGADYFLEWVDFDAALGDADLVITGEGSLDEQTPEGKGPWTVAVRARRRGATVVGLAGRVPMAPSALLRSHFDALIAIGHGSVSLEEALRNTAADLRRTAFDLGNLLMLEGRPS